MIKTNQRFAAYEAARPFDVRCSAHILLEQAEISVDRLRSTTGFRRAKKKIKRFGMSPLYQLCVTWIDDTLVAQAGNRRFAWQCVFLPYFLPLLLDQLTLLGGASKPLDYLEYVKQQQVCWKGLRQVIERDIKTGFPQVDCGFDGSVLLQLLFF